MVSRSNGCHSPPPRTGTRPPTLPSPPGDTGLAALGVGFTPFPWLGVWGDARQPSDEPNPKPHTVSWAKYLSLGQSPGFWGCHGTADPWWGQDLHRGFWPG